MLVLDASIERGGFRLVARLSVPACARVAVMGPSGAGKSTLLEALAGFVPAHGRMEWQGAALDGAPGTRPVAMLFQEDNLFPHLTVARNVALGIRPDGRLSRAERTRMEEALERVGLDGLGDRHPAQLSGGQRGRAALARVLLMRRLLVLLDEPFSALGPALKAEMLSLVREVVEELGATLLMITHDPEDARAVAEGIVVVADGRAESPRPTATLLADPPPALRRYLG